MTENAKLQLPSEISLETLDWWRAEIAARIPLGEALFIETDGLAVASLPLVQLFYAAQLSAGSQGCRLAVSCPPDGALAKALSGFGFLNAARGAPRIEAGVWSGLQPS